MNEIGAISAINSVPATDAATQVTITQMPTNPAINQAADPDATGFGAMLNDAVSSLDSKVAKADRMVTEFALDESTPIHHVTVALEEARVAVELAAQVRLRMTEGYRTIMNMQL